MSWIICPAHSISIRRSAYEKKSEDVNQTGLKYSDINEGDILVLCMLLQKELKGDKHAVSVNMRLSQMIEATYRHCGQLVECSIFVNSHYFKNRECITFNPLYLFDPIFFGFHPVFLLFLRDNLPQPPEHRCKMLL